MQAIYLLHSQCLYPHTFSPAMRMQITHVSGAVPRGNFFGFGVGRFKRFKGYTRFRTNFAKGVRAAKFWFGLNQKKLLSATLESASGKSSSEWLRLFTDCRTQTNAFQAASPPLMHPSLFGTSFINQSNDAAALASAAPLLMASDHFRSAVTDMLHHVNTSWTFARDCLSVCHSVCLSVCIKMAAVEYHYSNTEIAQVKCSRAAEHTFWQLQILRTCQIFKNSALQFSHLSPAFWTPTRFHVLSTSILQNILERETEN